MQDWLGGDSEAHLPESRRALKVGDLLVPYEGYQEGYNAWNDDRNRRINERMAKKGRKIGVPALW